MLFISPLPPLPQPQRRVLPADISQGPAPADWPFGELTQDQRLSRQRQRARLRAGTLPDLPSVLGDLA